MTATTNGSEPAFPDHSSNLELARNAERGLLYRIVIGVAVATPLCVALWVGLIALAVRHSAHGDGPLAMAVGVGVLNGVFFGTWAAFVASNDTFDELDHIADTMPELGGRHPSRSVTVTSAR